MAAPTLSAVLTQNNLDVSILAIVTTGTAPFTYTIDYDDGVTDSFTTSLTTHTFTHTYLDTTPKTIKVQVSDVVPVSSVTDNFNRTDSSTTINPASDGGTWFVPSGMVGGILGNAAYMPTTFNSATRPICRDLGQSSVDVSWTVARNATLNGDTMLIFAADQTISSQGYWIASNGKASGAGNSQPILFNLTSSILRNLTGGSDWTSGAFTTFRVLYVSSTGSINVWQDGVSLLSIVDPTPQTGTWVGFYDPGPYSQTGLLIDSIVATSGTQTLYSNIVLLSPVWVSGSATFGSNRIGFRSPSNRRTL